MFGVADAYQWLSVFINVIKCDVYRWVLLVFGRIKVDDNSDSSVGKPYQSGGDDVRQL